MSICQTGPLSAIFDLGNFKHLRQQCSQYFPLRSSINLTAKELCPKCCSEFSFAQLSLCSHNNPPLGESQVSQSKRNLENLIQGAPCTRYGKLWDVTALDCCSVQIPENIWRQKEQQRSQHFLGWFTTVVLENIYQYSGDTHRRAGTNRSKRWQATECRTWHVSCTIASSCDLELRIVAPGWVRQWV